MKKKQLQKKLVLNKKTVSDLNNLQMGGLHAGIQVIEYTKGTVQECCTVVNRYWCLSDPPTGCMTCAITDDDPCECKIGGIEPGQLT